MFTLSFVPNRVCEGVRLTEKKDCRLPTCWNTMDYYDDAQPSYAAATADMELQVRRSLDRPLFSSPCLFSPRCPLLQYRLKLLIRKRLTTWAASVSYKLINSLVT